MTPAAEMKVVLAMIARLAPWSDVEVDPAELHCLAENVYYEARGESVRGQIAVANVTVNRVSDPHYAWSICGVVHQDSQFSWTLHEKPEKTELEAWEQAVEISAFVMVGFIEDQTFGSIYYFDHNRVDPEWADDLVIVGDLGGHRFLRPN